MVLARDVFEFHPNELFLKLFGKIARLFGEVEIIPLAVGQEKWRGLGMRVVNGGRIVVGRLKLAKGSDGVDAAHRRNSSNRGRRDVVFLQIGGFEGKKRCKMSARGMSGQVNSRCVATILVDS